MSVAGVRPLNPGATLLHIGLPKTGTTAVQAAAAQLRGPLLEQGVCYPGIALNHGTASNALMGRSTAVFEAGPRARWERIADELRSHPDAIGWLSYEQIAQATPAVARRFLDELGPDLHVVITARAYVSVLPSAWQQWVKDAGDAPFETWIARVLDVRDREGGTEGSGPGTGFWRQHDLPAIARVWADLLGPERVHVVILDKSRPALLFDAFEGLLALEPGTLASAPRDALLSNRGMSRAEAELAQGVNALAHAAAAPVDPRVYYRVMRNGAISAVLRDREPTQDEGSIAASAPLAARFAHEGAAAARALAGLGVDVVGDLEALGALPGNPPAEAPAPCAAVDPELAALAVLGATSAALGEGVNFAGARLPGGEPVAGPGRPSRRAVLGALRRRARRAVAR
ncbi:hypothetical protein [Demequina maris]|uniref:hypothetical protein n=1 Tax=Demequina maris TaxID=1638982 RepID=UPI000785F5A2|nr:hypothetical protein [Demequina maris]